MGLYGGFRYGGDTYSGQAELDAWNFELGIEQGRIVPDNETPVHGNYVFVLGTDRRPFPIVDVAIGDKAELSQLIDVTAINYIKATWRTAQPSSMPEKATLSVASLKFGGVMSAGDTLLGLVTSTDAFVHSDLHRIVRIAGAANGGNNGDKRITGIVDARTVVLDSGIVATENPFLGTASLLGARWKASLLVGGKERASVVEVDGADKRRTDLVAHISKLTGAQTVMFRLELIEQP